MGPLHFFLGVDVRRHGDTFLSQAKYAEDVLDRARMTNCKPAATPINTKANLRGSTSTPSIIAYSDADWAGCPDTQRSTSGYCIYLGSALVSWSSKRQATVPRSSAEAGYRAVANAVAECIWLRQLLGELYIDIPSVTIAYCDNISAVYMSKNPVHHQQTKHIDLDIHFVRERVAFGDPRIVHVPTDQQFADVMTKSLPTATFTSFRSSLTVGLPNTVT
jgi:hypothetical protein